MGISGFSPKRRDEWLALDALVGSLDVEQPENKTAYNRLRDGLAVQLKSVSPAAVPDPNREMIT